MGCAFNHIIAFLPKN